MASTVRLGIGRQIVWAVVMVVVLFSGVNVFNYWQSRTMQQGYDEVMAAEPMINDIKDLQKELWRQNSQIRAFVMTKDERNLQEFQKSREQVETLYARLDSMLQTADGRKVSRLLRVVIDEYNKQQDNAIKARNTLGFEQSVRFVAATGERTDSIGTVLQSFTDGISQDIESRIAANKARMAMMQKVVLGISLVGFVLTISGGLWFARRIARPLEAVSAEVTYIAAGNLQRQMVAYKGNDEIGDLVQAFGTMVSNLRSMVGQVRTTAEQVTSASEELKQSAEQSAQAATSVAQTVTEVAGGAANQLLAIEEAVAESHDMASAITHIAQTAAGVSTKSGEAAATAVAGGKSVQEAVDQMHVISQAVTTSAAVVGRLGERSREIGEIVDVIHNISGQTNLLALNAAIEAARAGEAGRGFAVVADEVRKLAEQSKVAAQKIAHIVGDIQAETSAAVTAMNQGAVQVVRGTDAISDSGRQFTNIIDLVQNLNAQIIEISAAAEELAASSSTVVGSVTGIKHIAAETTAGTETISAATEEQSASMEQIAAASQGMLRLAEGLQTEVNRFLI